MSAVSYSKAGVKAAPQKLDNEVFGVEVKNHELLKQAYVSYLANGRQNLARALKRGEVRGGGKKPWKQKGTGRARFGSIRTPLWRGGGIIFGPTGDENYKLTVSTRAKQLALRQALSLAAREEKIIIIETFDCKDGKVSTTAKLLNKIGASGNVLIVVSVKDKLVERATRNLDGVKAVQANYLSVYDVLNADKVLISKKAIEMLSSRLGGKK